MPPDLLGHLMNRLQLQGPQKLGMVMSEVSLGRFEELFFGVSCELRPTLTESDPPRCSFDRSHGRHDRRAALSIRFQIVAGGGTQ